MVPLLSIDPRGPPPPRPQSETFHLGGKGQPNSVGVPEALEGFTTVFKTFHPVLCS